jgi:hypothetical protein
MNAVEYRAHLRDRLLASKVPFHLWEGLVEYLVARQPTGHFLTAILSNGLAEACARADPECRAHIADVVFFLVNYAPIAAWGSPSHVGDWLRSTRPVVEVE